MAVFEVSENRGDAMRLEKFIKPKFALETHKVSELMYYLG